MTLVEKLRTERNAKTVAYTNFLSDYKNNNNKIFYGFVEGKDDPSYYRNLVNKELPNECNIILYPTGNKDTVKYTYDRFDWRSFDKKQIVFFMDRDLSEIIVDLNNVNSDNVYITDNYSIENNIACSDTLESVLRDLLGFASSKQCDIDCILELYETEKNHFINEMICVMANLIFWKRNKVDPANYNNIKINKFLLIENGIVQITMNEIELLKFIYAKSDIDLSHYNETIVKDIIQEIIVKNIQTKIIRGKYIGEFFIAFCNSIFKDYMNLSIKKTHNGRQLGSRDLMETIAPRCRITPSLKNFIDRTILSQ